MELSQTMNTFRKSVLATAVVFGLAVASQARADLIISVNGGPNVGSADTTNTISSFSGAVGAFNINSIVAVGVGAFGTSGDLFDVSSLNVSTSGSGSLAVAVTETNLSLSAAQSQFQVDFSGTINAANVVRSFYIDPTNSGATTTLLGTSTLADASFFTAGIPLSGEFSLTEVINITAAGGGAKLSGDDNVAVPEPGVLSLMGLGLSAVAFLRRRKSI